MPAWDLLPGFPDAYPPAIYDYPRGPVATIAASRGCPFHCKFCDTSTFGARMRAYSPARVVEMIQYLHDRWGVRHIMFVDDLFLASRLRVTEFCERLLASGLRVSWTCTARVDTVKPGILALMKRAGCWEISFGLETGSNELLVAMDKAARVERSEEAVRWTHQAGLRTKGLFMLGYPGETSDTIRATREFVRRIPMDIMNLSKFTPYPGSPIYVDLYGTKIRPDDWRRMNGMNCGRLKASRSRSSTAPPPGLLVFLLPPPLCVPLPAPDLRYHALARLLAWAGYAARLRSLPPAGAGC
jgi:radical SAM superfamily enzyme YgiQ (UPF0313 family)